MANIDNDYKISALTGKSGSSVKLRYCPDENFTDNVSSVYRDGVDLYMETSVNNGLNWSAPMKIVGEDGKNAIVLTSLSVDVDYDGQIGVYNGRLYKGNLSDNSWECIEGEIPSDAVIHYSFDDIPYCPDGESLYNKDRNWTDSDGWRYASTSQTSITYTAENGCLVTRNTQGDSSRLWTQHAFAIKANMVFHMKIVSSFATSLLVYCYYNSKWNSLFTKAIEADTEYEINIVIPANATQIMYRDNESTHNVNDQLVVSEMYLGDGSNRLPILNNAENNYHASNFGARGVAGISGKGLKVDNSYVKVPLPFKPAEKRTFTIATWVKDWDKSKILYIADNWDSYKYHTLYFRAYASTSNTVVLDSIINNETKTFRRSTFFYNFNDNKNEYFIVGIFNGSNSELWINGEKIKLKSYINDVYSNESVDKDYLYIGKIINSSGGNSFSNAIFDDYQIFDRVLTENEIIGLYNVRGNTPKYFTESDYHFTIIDDDNKIDASEKRILLSKWSEIYNSSDSASLSTVLPTTDITINGEYKAVLDKASEVGLTVSQADVKNYIEAANAIRDALWGSNGYLLHMNQPSDIVEGGNINSLFSTYKMRYTDVQNAIANQVASQANAISIVQGNPFQMLPVNSSGAVTSYSGTDNTIQILEGGSVLTPVSSTLSNGSYKVTALGTNITAGTATPDTTKKVMKIGECSGLADNKDTASVEYTITGKDSTGESFTIYCSQKITRASQGADAVTYSFTATPLAMKSDDLQSVTFNAQKITGSNRQNFTSYLYKSTDGTSWSKVGSFTNGTISVSDISTTTQFALSTTEDGINKVDYITVSVVSDGGKGDTGEQGPKGDIGASVGNQLLRGTNGKLGSGGWGGRAWRSSTETTTSKVRYDDNTVPDSNIKVAWKFTNVNAATHTDIAQDSTPLVAGQTYTVSFWAKSSLSTAKVFFQYGRNSTTGYSPLTGSALTDKWERYSFTFTAAEKYIVDGVTNIYLGVSSCKNGDFYIAGMKMELGSIATDWKEYEGDISIEYSSTLTLTSTINGQATLKLYENKTLCQYIKYLKVRHKKNDGDYKPSSTVSDGTSFTGTYTWNYAGAAGNNMSYEVEIYEDSALTSLISKCSATALLRGSVNFSGTEIHHILDGENVETLTTASSGITEDTVIYVGDIYENSLTKDTWICSTGGSPTTAKWTYNGRNVTDYDDNNMMRFFSPSTPYSRGGSSALPEFTVTGKNPFGEMDLLLQVLKDDDESTTARCQPFYQWFKVDSTKTYRYVCFLKQITTSNTGDYFGLKGYNSAGDESVTTLSGAAVNSAYFASSSNFGEAGKWYMGVGYVIGSGETEAPDDAGVYDVETGNKVAECKAYKWKEGVTKVQHTGTLIGYNSGAKSDRIEKYLYDMRFDVVDGNEPTLKELRTKDTSNNIIQFDEMVYDPQYIVGSSFDWYNTKQRCVNKGDTLVIGTINADTGRVGTMYLVANESSDKALMSASMTINAEITNIIWGNVPQMPNLCMNSNFAFGVYGWTVSKNMVSGNQIGYDSKVGTYYKYMKDTVDGSYNNGYRVYTGGTNSPADMTQRLLAGKKYAVSFWAKADAEGQKIRTHVSNSNIVETTLTTEWKYYSFMLSVTKDSTAFTVATPYYANNTIYIAQPKIELNDEASKYNLYSGESERVYGEYIIKTQPTLLSTTVYGVQAYYRYAVSDIEKLPMIDDKLIYNNDYYTVLMLTATYIYLSNPVSNKGEKGDNGGFQDYQFAVGDFGITKTEDFLKLKWDDIPPEVPVGKCLYMATKWIKPENVVTTSDDEGISINSDDIETTNLSDED